ncbi:stalk domain-containing protein [Saccharibacillus sp. JS10]|uniref:stalk domain-containing protein n=1 Tax=Saccharibacillus sp. JS10 TaxID=2950552 RepID=UPI00210F04A0|nr:stalk domain-containing protein [Saccharibacillus sp. JS10]MCQ4085874.1 stalk domain-containing protein [Saccharibacillus sp. JS10]
MKDKLKGLVAGLLIGTMITGSAALAANTQAIQVTITNMSLYFNLEKKTTNKTINYNGTTYVPVRAVSSAIGQEVTLKNGGLYIGRQPKNTSITKEQAVKLVKAKYGYDSSSIYVEVDHMEDNNYVVHVYEVVMDDEETGHTATYGWYHVNKTTGKITSMF